MQMCGLVIPNNVALFFSFLLVCWGKQVVYPHNNIVPIKVKSLYLKEEEKKTIYPDDDRRINGQHLCCQILSLFSLLTVFIDIVKPTM